MVIEEVIDINYYDQLGKSYEKLPGGSTFEQYNIKKQNEIINKIHLLGLDINYIERMIRRFNEIDEEQLKKPLINSFYDYKIFKIFDTIKL